MYPVFLPSFTEIGKAELAEVTKRVRVFITKRLVFCPVLWSDLAKKIYRITLPPFPIDLSRFV